MRCSQSQPFRQFLPTASSLGAQTTSRSSFSSSGRPSLRKSRFGSGLAGLGDLFRRALGIGPLDVILRTSHSFGRDSVHASRSPRKESHPGQKGRRDFRLGVVWAILFDGWRVRAPSAEEQSFFFAGRQHRRIAPRDAAATLPLDRMVSDRIACFAFVALLESKRPRAHRWPRSCYF